MIESRVFFLHRTVVEFLQSPNIWNGLLRLTSEIAFDPNISLLNAYLLEVKTNTAEKSVDVCDSVIWRSMRSCLSYARLVESTGGGSQAIYINELDLAMSHHWSTIDQWYDQDPENCFSPMGSSQPNHWACSALRILEGLGDTPEYSDADTTVYSLAASAGLVLYLREKWAQNRMAITAGQARQIVVAAISSHARNFKEKTSPRSRDSLSKFVEHDGTVPSENYVKIVEFLLQQDTNAFQDAKGKAKIWILALNRTCVLDDYSQSFGNSSVEDEIVLWSKMLEIVISSGADPNARIELGESPGVHQQSALCIISSLFTQLPSQSSAQPVVTSAQDRLLRLLKARGALEREWLYGRLVKGPPESPLVVQVPSRPSSSSTADKRAGLVEGLRGRVKLFSRNRQTK